MEEHQQRSHTFLDMLRQLRLLISLVLILIAVALAAYAYTAVKEATYRFTGPTTISVSGVGESLARPDVATFSFSVFAETKDPASAQEQSAESINTITGFLEDAGIEEKDIKTIHYNLSPRYEYVRDGICSEGFCPPGRQELVGYSVNQTIQVKVREVSSAGDVISGVGERGATNISGLTFTIDDEEALQAEAREAAIADAKAKAEALADDLDVRLVRLLSFHESGGDFYPHPEFGFATAGSEDMALRVAPNLPTGENTVSSNVTLIYEIR